MKNLFLLLMALTVQGAHLNAQEAPDAFPDPGAREENYTMKVTARVIDEDGKPMANTPILVRIENVNDFRDGFNDFRGVTDAEGKFSAEGVGRGLAKIEVRKDGFYVSEKTVTCYKGTADEIRKAGRFFPWNPIVDVMVKKIGKPVPMIVRLAWGRSRSWIKPKEGRLGNEIGWDLVEGDWVRPHGTGEVADLIVEFQTSYTNESNNSASVRIKFGNASDGFIALKKLTGEESILKFPRKAPKDGYGIGELRFSLEFANGELKIFPDEKPKGYLLRLRTEKNENGDIVSAIYGKITSPFELHGPNASYQLPILNFDYYLNPTPNDRNLEYDQTNNLAPEVDKDLRWPP